MTKLGNSVVNIIGAGLAGCEASLFLANHGVKIRLYDMKPKEKSPAHSSMNFGELVCSNSLKSTLLSTASGLLKKELEILGSQVLKVANEVSVPCGSALGVDREKFSDTLTTLIKNNENIEVIEEKVDRIDEGNLTVIATGPLTDESLMKEINRLVGENNFFFYDAISPIISSDSVDMSFAYWGNRWDKGESETGDYLNCPMNKEEYELFWNELINAERLPLHDFEDNKVFEGCMPVEVMARRGEKALLFGPLRPVGLMDKRTEKRPYAVLQLRKENREGSLLNLVGFQTNLRFGEQKRVFSLIPALHHAEFLKYGVMHRNSFLNAPKVLNDKLQLRSAEKVFIAGQLSGVEGYVESFGSGLFVAINILRILNKKKPVALPKSSCLGAIINYITTYEGKVFQPMNANFGVLPELNEFVKDKDKRKEEKVKVAIDSIEKFKKEYMNIWEI